MKNKVKKSLSFKKLTVSDFDQLDSNQVKGGAAWWTGGCTDGCTSGWFKTTLNCTNQNCSADCNHTSCSTNCGTNC